MALPPPEDLSRWTVSHVSNWLAKCSLSAFRDDFLRDSIDGSRLMRLTNQEVNQRYRHINSKKRNILIDHLKKFESSRQPPTRNAVPSIPPRHGGNSRPPAPQPVQNIEESDESDGSWPDDDFDGDDDDGSDYLEPASKPLDNDHLSGYNTNGHMVHSPEEAYEIPDEHLEEIRQLERKATIVDRLKDELVKKKNRDDQLSVPEAPPPRPPRHGRGQGGVSPRSVSPVHHSSPMPVPPAQNVLPSDDMYEVMNDVITETKKYPVQHYQAAEEEESVPPKSTKRGMKEIPPEAQPPPQRTRQPYTEVKKPGRLVQQDELSGYDWYHGKLGRDHAQRIFEREQQDGMFMIRKSERDARQPYTLVIWHGNRIWNLPIRKKESGNYAAGKYKDGETEFASVPELVEHFKVVSLNLKSNSAIQGTHNLTVPAPKD